MILTKNEEWLYNVFINNISVEETKNTPGHYFISIKPTYLDKKYDEELYLKSLNNVYNVAREYIEQLKAEYKDIYLTKFDNNVLKDKVFKYLESI